MSDRFKDFVPHQDNVGEIISAQDVNVLQDESESQQRTLFAMDDQAFLNKALFVLENHPIVNTMMPILFDLPLIDLALSYRINYDVNERSIVLNPATFLDGCYYSPTHINRNSSTVSNVLLLAMDYRPAGTNIVYEVSNNGVDYQVITPNSSAPLALTTDGTRLKLRAKLSKTSEDIVENPTIKAIALLYRDPKVGIIELPGGEVIIPGASLGGDING